MSTTLRFSLVLCLALLACQSLTRSLHAQWTQAGPSGGVVHTLLIRSANTLFIGTDNGVYRSTNDGDTWIESSSGIPANTSIRVLVQTSTTLFAGTSLGVYRSSDGISWQSSSGLNGMVNCVYTDNTFMLAGTPDGLYRSSDAGASWTLAGFAGRRVNALHKKDSLLYLGASFTLNGTLYESRSNGQTWQALPFLNNTAFEVTALTTFQDSLYIGGTLPSATVGFYSGLVIVKSNTSGYRRVFGRSYVTINSLAANNDTLFVSTEGGLYRGVNSQASFELILPPGGGAEARYVCSINRQLYCGMIGGLFVSTTNGISWNSKNNTLYTHHINSIATGDRRSLYLAMNGGVFRKRHTAPDWFATPLVSNVLSITADSLTVFAGERYSGGIRISTNEGNTWVSGGILTFPSDVTDVFISQFYRLMTLRNVDAGVTVGGIYKLPEGTNLLSEEIDAYRLFRYSTTEIFGATGRGIFFSSNDGLTWTRRSQNVDSAKTFAFAAINNRVYAATERGLFVSSNTGQNWAAFSTNLPSGNTVHALASVGNFLFAMTDNTIYRMTNEDGVFVPVMEGIPAQTQFLSLDADTQYLYAGTPNRGLWQRPLSQLSVQQLSSVQPIRFALGQNYPNPFNPSTEIRYQISGTSDVSLEVFDVLGRKVSTLVRERQPGGAYRVNFNAANFASGVYFYKIQAGNNLATKKMMLVK
jgi:ligand-binding sensor domain-containing protein